MESYWIKTFGALFAIGGAVSAVLQAKWLRDQRKTLLGILDVLQTMRDDGKPLNQAPEVVEVITG